MTSFWFIVAVVAFNVIRAIMKGMKEEGAPPAPLRPKARRPSQAAITRGAAPHVVVVPRPGPPAPRQKGAEQLWQEMLGQLQQTESARRSGQLPVEAVEEWEETRSLEVEARVESLEGRGTGRTLRVRVDRDEEAQGVSEGRKLAAASRDGAITTGDHAAFDGSIRAAVAAPVILTKGRDDLRRAMIWREVLGPPVSLREE